MIKKSKKLLFIVITIIIFSFSRQTVFAATSDLTVGAVGLQTSKPVTGTVDLLNDGSKALMIISPLVTVLLLLIQTFKGQFADDQEDKPVKKHTRKIITLGVGAFLVSTIFNLILGYYT